MDFSLVLNVVRDVGQSAEKNSNGAVAIRLFRQRLKFERSISLIGRTDLTKL
ncbi:hypothetical protein [Collimonas sp. PA-H2]|uniref:hypothetical protein n=1 Tax=Collimonas sp. PA-H2 TaxID=1881062 RepID=UPI0013046D1E|nr:hypothetical protein [Collimonas sp. PA-H2]